MRLGVTSNLCSARKMSNVVRVNFGNPRNDKDVKPLLACRGCLGASRPLRPLERALAALYEDLVGPNVSPSDILPKFVCSYCHAMLLKFKAFRDKCQSSQAALCNLYYAGNIPITLDLLQSVATEAPYPNLQICTQQLSRDSNDQESKYEDVKILKIKEEPPHQTFDSDISTKEMDIKLFISSDTNSSGHNSFEGTSEKLSKDTKNDVTKTVPKKRSALESATKTTSKKTRSNAKKSRQKVPKLKSSACNEVYDGKIMLFEQKYNFKAIALSKEEQIERIKARKNAPNYKDANFKCEMCFHTFVTENTFKNHLAKHDARQGDSICEVCSVSYPSKLKLKEHIRRLHAFEYICNECGTVCKHNIGAVNHYKSHRGVTYDCKLCGKSFKSRTSLISHTHLTHGGSVQCTICSETFIGEKGLKSHMSMSHKEALDAVCVDCGVQFKSFSALQRHHAAGDHSQRPCAVCGDTFPNDKLLQEHKHKEHKKSFDCETCGRKFYTQKKLRSHFSMHAASYNKKPTSISMSKGKEGVYVCELCGITKTNVKSLDVHIRTHTKPFQCNHCDLNFGAKNSLKYHLTTKHKEFPSTPLSADWACQYCDKCFTSNKDRHRHETLVHLKLRPYSCTMCGATYQDKNSLQMHINTKHLGMPWPQRDRKTTS